MPRGIPGKTAPLKPRQMAQMARKQQQAVERHQDRQRFECVKGERLLRVQTRAQRIYALRQEQRELRELQGIFRHLLPYEGLWDDVWLSVRLCFEFLSLLCCMEGLVLCVTLVTFLSLLPVLMSFAYWCIKQIFHYGILITLAIKVWQYLRASWNWIYYYKQRRLLQTTEAQTTCAVCLEEFEPEEEANGNGSNQECRVLACGHCFHVDCIKSWLARSRCCPLCRLHA